MMRLLTQRISINHRFARAGAFGLAFFALKGLAWLLLPLIMLRLS